MTALCSISVLGSGMDPDLQMDIITELDLVNTTLGVTQVSGLNNASKAFLFHGKGSLPLHGAGLAGEVVWRVFIWCVFVGRSFLLFLLCYRHKES